MPQVSVVMPVYNARPYLSDAIESVLGQVLGDFELIIVNDGSSDGSAEVIDRYAKADSRIVVVHQANQGIVSALNNGISRARGPFLARMDSDDIAMPMRFAHQVGFLRDHPDYVLVGSRVQCIDRKRRVVAEDFLLNSHEELEASLLRGCSPVAHPSVMIRREAVVAAGGYRREFQLAEDFDLWLRLLDVGRLYNLPEVLLKYRIHPTSLTSSRWAECVQATRNALLQACERRGVGVPPIWMATAGASLPPAKRDPQMALARRALVSGHYRNAVQISWERLRHWPLSSECLLTGALVLGGALGRVAVRRWYHLSGNKVWVSGAGLDRATGMKPTASVREFVSVVMPVHNGMPYLKEAVLSILDQTLPAFELIVVDDGSTDATLQVLEELQRADPRIHIVRQAKCGIVAALNRGVAEAKGEYVARMDADDIAMPNRLARQEEFLRGHPECVAVGSRTLSIDPDGIPICIEFRAIEHEAIDARHLKGICSMAHPSVMFRKNAFLRVGCYRNGFVTAQDLDLWLRMAETGRLANLPEVLLKYRIRPGSHSAERSHLKRTLLRRMLTDAYERRRLKMAVPEEPVDSRVAMGTPREFFSYCARKAILDGTWHDAVVLAKKAARQSGHATWREWSTLVLARLGPAGRVMLRGWYGLQML